MIRQICNVKPQDTATIRSIELLAWLGIEDLDLILKGRRLRWYGHVERSNGAVKTVFDIQVNGKRGPGRPKMTWKQLTERDRREWKLSAIDPHDRDTWRSGVSRGDQIFFSATCPGQVGSKNPLVLRNFLLVPKYFSNCKSLIRLQIPLFLIQKCNSNQTEL